MSRVGKSMNRKPTTGCQGLGQGGDREQLLMDVGFLLGVMKMFWNEVVVLVVEPYEYIKNS